ncbi:hypothetical protein [Desulfoscipio gibsoniae]|uniref:Uncharacterized protein n=1 Tax=Desulfoscipio gibsoniae DSM 7213 TaxID=767817 RepID=R4KNU6_9FIRM|nr:hypothetical protein [Desulfoscipio gibsoniae]AGL02230.1 hypothetical protein Desgi_2829 [Desulfoscipio gibsoniae DSM 7213]
MGFKDLEKRTRDYNKSADADRRELDDPQLTAEEEQDSIKQ